jgi:hypothetical protein
MKKKKTKVTTTTTKNNKKQKYEKWKTKKNEVTTLKKWENGKICNGTYLWCSNWCQSSELQPTHGKGKGSTILTNQNRVTM